MSPNPLLAVWQTIWRNHRGKLGLSALVVAGGIGSTLFLASRKPRRARESDLLSLVKSQQQRKERVAVDGLFLRRFRRILEILFPRIMCRETYKLAGLTAFLLLRTVLSIKIAVIAGANAKLLVDRKFNKFVRGVFGFGALAVPAAICNAMLKYLNNSIAVNFRQRLSGHLHGVYLSDITFYQLINSADQRLDNCDQRITEDVHKFCVSLSELYTQTFKPIVDFVLYGIKLSHLVGLNGMLVMLGYYLVSAGVLRAVMPSFARLTAEQQMLEGNFRTVHNRIITYSEEIAFLGGGKREKSIVNTCFEAVMRHAHHMFAMQAGVNLADGMLVKYGATMMGYAVCAIPAFDEKRRARLGATSEAALTAVLTQNYIRDSRLLINLAQATGQLIMLYKGVTSLAGYCTRVAQMLEMLEQFKGRPLNAHGLVDAVKADMGKRAVPAPGVVAYGQEIILDHVNVQAPKEPEPMMRDLTLRIPAGRNVMVAGPNGCGKTSLLRVLAELWPLTRGRIVRPPNKDIFFVPQKHYLVLGTLRDQIIYPDNVAQMRLKGYDDGKLMQLMESVELRHLVTREDAGFDAVHEWSEVLSGGEKQRVGVARLYYHQPKFAVLDDCTSAVSVDVEHLLYTHSREIGCTLITISHRRSLWKFHDFLLSFDDSNQWSFAKITEEMLSKANAPLTNVSQVSGRSV